MSKDSSELLSKGVFIAGAGAIKRFETAELRTSL